MNGTALQCWHERPAVFKAACHPSLAYRERFEIKERLERHRLWIVVALAELLPRSFGGA